MLCLLSLSLALSLALSRALSLGFKGHMDQHTLPYVSAFIGNDSAYVPNHTRSTLTHTWYVYGIRLYTHHDMGRYTPCMAYMGFNTSIPYIPYGMYHGMYLPIHGMYMVYVHPIYVHPIYQLCKGDIDSVLNNGYRPNQLCTSIGRYPLISTESI